MATAEKGRTTDLNHVSGQIVDAALKVHTALGPGLLERAYEACLCLELRQEGLCLERQVLMPITYKGEKIDLGYRIDLLVENSVVVEIKAIKSILPVHEAQLLSYLRLSNRRVGLLLNFHVPHMRYGIKRLINSH